MWHTLKKQEVLNNLKTNEAQGLTEEEVTKRQKEYGKNKLEEKKKESYLVKFIKQFNDFMIIILIIASILSAVISCSSNTLLATPVPSFVKPYKTCSVPM